MSEITTTDDDVTAGNGARDGSGLVVQYPSADFPPTPAFRLRIPDDWVALAATSAEMAVSAPEPIDGFHTNVIVSARRVPSADEPVAVLAASVDRELEAAGYEVVESMSFDDDVTPAHAATVRFTTPNDVLVEAHQLHVYVPSSGRSAHVLSVTGTVPTSAPEALRAGLMKVVRSLHVAGIPDGAAAQAPPAPSSDNAVSTQHPDAVAPGDSLAPRGDEVTIPHPPPAQHSGM